MSNTLRNSRRNTRNLNNYVDVVPDDIHQQEWPRPRCNTSGPLCAPRASARAPGWQGARARLNASAANDREPSRKEPGPDSVLTPEHQDVASVAAFVVIVVVVVGAIAVVLTVRRSAQLALLPRQCPQVWVLPKVWA